MTLALPHHWPVLPTQGALHLDDREVHVVCVELDGVNALDELLRLLDPGERARAQCFIFDDDRRRFIVAHAFMRIVLGRYLGCEPQVIAYELGRHGKPTLAHPMSQLRFNLSHAGERALFAVSHDRDVGVDIERDRSLEVLQLAERFFAVNELNALRPLSEDAQRSAFFRCWVRKESFIKALGDGLSFPLNGFEVSVTEDDGEQALLACTVAPQEVHRWRIRTVPSEMGYSAAVTANREPWGLVVWQQPDLRECAEPVA
jgi:4'-phosphopantetheinyl transferase